MKAKIFSWIFLFPALAFYGQANDENRNAADSTEDRRTISAVMGLSYLQNSFGFLYEGKVFRLRPNDAFYTEFFMRYRWLDISYTFAPKLTRINNDDPEKGKTKYFNLGFTFFVTRKLRQYVYFSEVRGLYFQDTKEYMRFVLDQNYDLDGYLQFPDAKYRSYRGETSYLWMGDKTEYRSFGNMTYRPVKDVFIISTGLFYQYNMLSNLGKTIYQGEVFTDDEDGSASRDFRIAVRPGGGIQKKIKKNWYAVLEMYPELYYSKLQGEKWHEFNIGLYSNARIGYDDGKWFFGGGTQLNWVNSSNENFYSATQWLFRVGMGFRFNSPTFVNRNFDRIDHIVK